MKITDQTTLKLVIEEAVNNVEITDVHTHIYSTGFKNLLLWGIDELLTYHYLIAEFFRYSTMSYNEFFKLSKKEQANLIWETLFIQNSPVSEAQRGVLTVLAKLGLDLSTRDLESYRKYFNDMTVDEYISKVFEVAGVKEVVMTNDPFDSLEQPIWELVGNKDSRFKAALRIDPLLNQYETTYIKLQEWGYNVSRNLDEETIGEIKRFLKDWIKKTSSLYMAVSLPPTFMLPEASDRSRIIEQCIVPVCSEFNIPFAMMIGVNKLVNYDLGLAGDSLGKSNIEVVEYLCKTYSKNKFMVTMLSRENQHELAITARKFRNLMVFGCWWFLNNPSIIEEMTRIRMETLGLSFIPQHSDARVLDQLIYKWTHSRKIIEKVLIDKYNDLLVNNWIITKEEINRDVENIFGGTFWTFINKEI
ncbi:glucuronate isomerase [Alkaliphilus peptidifermentans]|uniref:Glucuronate isomerase n=1 Tax=Alkaliphilus peptidifermentans DSM 18978 TaxID=1120976 RepID=A0A1G5F108_9FIRM|nr:glucuronate isomerase [Alkaliphilus peptidifermentans]SCY32791.1 hypothetical protein SAMN03080606_01296 [Alkaliphilus peptidifermentans DSM 18978]